mgnify:CR=1 FL=1
MDWSEIFKKVGTHFKDNGETYANLGKFGGSIANGIGAYGQYKTAQESNDLARDAYDFNKSLANRGIAKENLGQENMTEGFNAVFGTTPKKKKLSDYAGMMNYGA